jgi:flagellar biosynthesis/type III secretory pathway protein FliH
MALIKQANARDLARDAIVLDLGDLQRQGAMLVTQARAQAEAIIAEARAERQRILAGAAEQGHAEGLAAGHAAGHQAGFEAGRAAALAEFKDQLAKLDAAWSAAAESFNNSREHLLRSAQRDVLRVAVRIAERVTKRVIRIDPAVAAAQLEAVLAVVVRPTRLTVRIHPDDRPTVEAALPRLAAIFTAARHVELVEDPSLTRGSCIAVTRPPGSSDADTGLGGEIDASISTQLDRIVEALLPADITPPSEPAAPVDTSDPAAPTDDAPPAGAPT